MKILILAAALVTAAGIAVTGVPAAQQAVQHAIQQINPCASHPIGQAYYALGCDFVEGTDHPTNRHWSPNDHTPTNVTNWFTMHTFRDRYGITDYRYTNCVAWDDPATGQHWYRCDTGALLPVKLEPRFF